MEPKPMQCWNYRIGDRGFPLPGLNDNVDFMGRQLHIQTESMEFPDPCIVTHVFHKGRVILSRKSEYPIEIREKSDTAKLQELMHTQHFEIIQSIADKQSRIRDSR